MKLKTLGMLAGLALTALPCTTAFAHTDVFVDLRAPLPPLPAAVVVEDEYYAPAPAYYGYPRHYYYGPRFDARADWRWHDRGWHGHRHHRHWDRDD